MSRLQSKDNIYSAGFLNVNYLKFVFAVILYLIAEVLISVELCYTVKTVACFFIPVGSIDYINCFLQLDNNVLEIPGILQKNDGRFI